MRVLYLANSAQIGGGNRSLLSLWDGLKQSRISPLAVSPSDGPMVACCHEMGIPCQVLKYKQPGLDHPFYSVRAYRQWRQILSELRVDLVHANDLYNARSISFSA